MTSSQQCFHWPARRAPAAGAACWYSQLKQHAALSSLPRGLAQPFLLLMSKKSCHSASIQFCRASLLSTRRVLVTSSSP